MFKLTADVKIRSEMAEKPVELAIKRFQRDLEATLEKGGASPGEIRICRDADLEEEAFTIRIEDGEMTIRAADSLGCIYALNHISREYLGIQPFWFWNDQEFVKTKSKSLENKVIVSPKAAYRFRGWFINDEVLISAWKVDGSESAPWEMAMEALLRLGGNMVIPGTDHNSKKYSGLASDMGLWITHHHAEPLGAEMFSRAYPERTPSFLRHPDLYRKLWREGVERQKGQKVIWNIGFRGQGDRPFWADDAAYDTDESRGGMIGAIMEEQRGIVREYVEKPVFCTNLYGEMVELYQKGFLKIPADTVKIWADNGYGKMVSRRQELDNPRAVALPAEGLETDSHGAYYHASFYDLQAASHITMLPNSIRMVRDELVHARQRGIRDFLVVNCSNVKPHVYVLEAIAELWENGDLDVEAYPSRYAKAYFSGSNAKVADLFEAYAGYAPRYGVHEDDGCGDQFYSYSTRQFISQWLKGDTEASVKGMRWAWEEESFGKQIEGYLEICRKAEENYREACAGTELVRKDIASKELLEDSIGLQYKMYYHFALGGVKFCEAYGLYREGDYLGAFYRLGQAKEAFEAADQAMRDREHHKWAGFYRNDCLTDVKQTAYWLGILMGVVRNLEDGPHFFLWQREVLYPPEDKKVVLITNYENHLTNEELYQAMKKKEGFRP